MNSDELLRIVDVIHRDKGLDKEIVFQGLEAALLSAAKRHYGDDAQVTLRIDRETGELSGECEGEEIDPREISERIAAQTARQVMIQKIREAERDAVCDEYQKLQGQMVVGTVLR
ncbi:MAG: NusA N-terminal domain-containing protein, partial [Planctomycetia bacterium]|nr:NusA N-terminal domain-containing protein [Planctomycetia bacterium]